MFPSLKFLIGEHYSYIGATRTDGAKVFKGGHNTTPHLPISSGQIPLERLYSCSSLKLMRVGLQDNKEFHEFRAEALHFHCTSHVLFYPALTPRFKRLQFTHNPQGTFGLVGM